MLKSWRRPFLCESKRLLNTVFKLLVITVVLLCAQFTSGQTWRRFSPPDRSFTIELPARPKLVKNKQDSPQALFNFGKVNSGYAYKVKLGFEKEPELLVAVARLSRPLRDEAFDKTVDSLMLFVAGDDKHFSRKSDVVVAGFHGREFVYDKGVMRGRALFLNSGRRVYLLIFGTEVDGAISSSTVERVFKSFRPLK